MENPPKVVQLKSTMGKPVTVGDVIVTPQSQSLVLRWPNGGFVYNRPQAVLVEWGEFTQRLPVVDVTRLAQLGLLALSLFVFLIGLTSSTRVRRS